MNVSRIYWLSFSSVFSLYQLLGEIFGSLAAKSSTVFSLSNFVSLLFGAEQEVHSGFLELKQPPAAAENTTLSATREAGQIKISVIATLTCHLRIL